MKTFVRERYDWPVRQDDRWIGQSIFRLFISVEERTNVVILNYLSILVTVQNVLSFWAFYKRKERIFVTVEFVMFDKRKTQYETPLSTFVIIQWRIQGEGPGGPDPAPPPIWPDACLRLKFLHRQDRVSLFNWLIVFRFGLLSYDLLAPTRKAVLPAPTGTIPAFTDWETRSRLCFLSGSTIISFTSTVRGQGIITRNRD